MPIDHLTEQQLQRYAEGEPLHDKAEIEGHLRSCKKCREQAIAYKFVQIGMAQEPQDALFSDGFEDTLMTRIMRPDTGGFQMRDYLVAAFASVIVMASLCYPFLYGQISILIVDPFVESWGLLKELALDVFCHGEYNINCMMVPVASLIVILAFKMLDKIYIEPRIRTTHDEV